MTVQILYVKRRVRKRSVEKGTKLILPDVISSKYYVLIQLIPSCTVCPVEPPVVQLIQYRVLLDCLTVEVVLYLNVGIEGPCHSALDSDCCYSGHFYFQWYQNSIFRLCLQ